MQHNESQTKLKKGDKCRWFKRQGTIAFIRGAKYMRIHDGKDDKFCVPSMSFIEFATIVQMLSEATGKKANICRDDESYTEYLFT